MNVKRGVLDEGVRVLFYGPESVGKTTLASSAPSPLMIDVEDGSGQINVDRYMFGDTHVPQTYIQVRDAVEDMIASEHDYKSLVIDSLDRLENLIHDFCIERDSGKSSQLNQGGKKLLSIESYGFGKGYTVALEEWRRFSALLDRLRRAKGVNIVLVGHSMIKLFRDPIGEDFDRYQLRIHERSAAWMKEFCDVVGFCTFEEGAHKMDSNQTKAKGFSTGRRIVKLERTAAFDAKSRIPLPREVAMDPDDPWGPFALAIAMGKGLDEAGMVGLIEAELARIGDDDLAAKVHAAIDRTKNTKDSASTLVRYLNNLKERNQEESTDV